MLMIIGGYVFAQNDSIPPIASFSISDSVVCRSNGVVVTNTSQHANSYEWVLTGAVDAAFSTTNIYLSNNGTNTGWCNIRLVAYNGYGSDTAYTQVFIDPTVFELDVTDLGLFCGEGTKYVLTPVFTPPPPPDFVLDVDTITVFHSLMGYTPNYWTTNQYGCAFGNDNTVLYSPYQGPPQIYSEDSFIDNADYTMSNPPALCEGILPSVSIGWSPPSGYASLNWSGSQFWYEINCCNCPPVVSSMVHTVRYMPHPILESTVTDICLGESIVLNASQVDYAAPHWITNDNSFNSDLVSGSHTYIATPEEPGDYSYRISNYSANFSSGCSSNLVTVHVMAGPAVNLYLPDTIHAEQVGSSVCLDALPISTDTYYYLWQGIGIDTSNHTPSICLAPNANFYPYAGTWLTYSVEAIHNTTGCSTILTDSIYVDPPLGFTSYHLANNLLPFVLQATGDEGMFLLHSDKLIGASYLIIYDIVGRKVYEKSMFSANASLNETIQLPAYCTKGSYIAVLQNGQNKYAYHLLAGL